MEKSKLLLSVETFENVWVMLQKTKECLNTIKIYPGRIFIKFERVEGSFEILFCMHSTGIFTKFRVIPIMNH